MKQLLSSALTASCAGAFAAGLLLTPALAVRTPALACLFPLCCLALLLAALGKRWLAALPLLAAFASAGLARGALPEETPVPCARALRASGLPAPDLSAAASLELWGVVQSAPEVHLDRGAFRMRVQEARGILDPPPGERAAGPRPLSPPAPFPALLEITGSASDMPLPGDGIRLHALLDEPAEGWADELRRSGVVCSGRLLDGRIAVIEPASGIAAGVERLRRRIAVILARSLGPGPDAAVVRALAVGDRSAVDLLQARRFADSGLAHLLSVSGLHVALVVLGFFRLLALLLSRLRWPLDPRRTAALLTLPLAPLYAAMTGGNPPVLRAAVGGSLYLLAVAAVRAFDPATALVVAALGVLAIDPASLGTASFQLSFAACAGLLVLGPSLRLVAPARLGAPGRHVASAVSATVAATLATLPLMALHFGRVSLVSLPANVVAVPVGLAATVAAALAGLVALVAPAWVLVLAYPAGALATILDTLAGFFAALPFSFVAVPPPGPADVGAWILLVAFVLLVRRRRRPALAALALSAALAVVPRLLPPRGDGLLHVDFLDVGQGDSTLLRLPDGEAILVDAGGDLRGRERVPPALRQVQALGVHRLRAVVITHLHPDHAGDAPAVIDALALDELWTSGRPLDGPLGGPLAAAAARAGATRKILAAGSPPLDVGGVHIEVLGPPDRGGLREDPLLGENDASLVLRVVFGSTALLLPGDVEGAGEEALLATGHDLGASLLKAPHHGSRTSSSEGFIAAVHPADVVFCVGRHNSFGFPHQEVVERYKAAGCRLGRTDQGALSFESDGRVFREVAADAVREQPSWAWK